MVNLFDALAGASWVVRLDHDFDARWDDELKKRLWKIEIRPNVLEDELGAVALSVEEDDSQQLTGLGVELDLHVLELFVPSHRYEM